MARQLSDLIDAAADASLAVKFLSQVQFASFAAKGVAPSCGCERLPAMAGNQSRLIDAEPTKNLFIEMLFRDIQ